jgi:peroxiredoxin
MANYKIGDKVPNFVLKDQHNKEVRLDDFKGKKVLLSFHPLAWTPVCTTQMQSLEENLNKLEELNTVPLGLSIDSQFTKKAWADNIGIKSVHLLADLWPHGDVANKLGILRQKEGFSERANIILDEEGKIIFLKIYDIPEVPDMQEIIDFLEEYNR